MLLQHRQLIEQRAVEDHIGMLLIWEDPPLLPLAHRVPHCQCMGHRGSPGLIIPDDAPEEPEIAGGNPVVIVQIQGQQRADIHAENQIRIHILWQQRRVQAMQPLHQHHRVFVHLQALAPGSSPSSQEVKPG